MSSAGQPLSKLERTIASRAANPNPKSYTSKLLAGGVAMIGAKVTEEAAEVVEAAGEDGETGREHFIREVGDLVYHLLVLMRLRMTTLSDLEAELARRFGVSGLEEKSSRSTPAAAMDTPALPTNDRPVRKRVVRKKSASKPKKKAKAESKTAARRKSKAKR